MVSVAGKKEVGEVKLSGKSEVDAFFEGAITYLTDVLGTAIPPIGFAIKWRQKRQEIKEAEVFRNLKEQLSQNTQDVANISNLLKNPKGAALFNKILFLARSIIPI